MDKQIIFEWDENKNCTNKRKHGVSFELASLVFADPLAHSEIDVRYIDDEHWQTVGKVGSLHLVVAHLYKESSNEEEVIRIISARKASAREKRRYHNDP